MFRVGSARWASVPLIKSVVPCPCRFDLIYFTEDNFVSSFCLLRELKDQKEPPPPPQRLFAFTQVNHSETAVYEITALFLKGAISRLYTYILPVLFQTLKEGLFAQKKAVQALQNNCFSHSAWRGCSGSFTSSLTCCTIMYFFVLGVLVGIQWKFFIMGPF